MEALSWEAREYQSRRKPADWFWALGIIAIAGAAASFIFGNILFAIVILIGSFTLALHTAKQPEIVRFALTDAGIVIGNTVYPYRELESFSIVEKHDSSEYILLVTSQKTFVPRLTIPLTSTDPDHVYAILKEHLPEKEQEPSLLESISTFLGL